MTTDTTPKKAEAAPQHPLAQAAQECITLWRDLGHPMLLAAARELEDRIAALPAQMSALTVEVWMNSNGYAELVSVTGRVTAQVWEDLETDLTENPHVLLEGAYTVPVDKDSTDVTGESGCFTYALDWNRAVPIPLRNYGDVEAGEAL
ncbi:hypothetical protein [Deinococcus soli (ex Cha et al. 2016)]|uniref:hypothetical protein n=1 Tax=Deinococcus soli (ex Cha et al. 2016) TaxID=1309411 RepID=UPI00166491B8|nr:hypothetical protein [Deinococcus soli (ex Cha et al. 2016)]